MKTRSIVLPLLTLLALVACAGSEGNLKTAADYDAPPPPEVKNPLYDPYAGYGESNATWQPPVVDRAGKIVKPVEPSTHWDRPDYENAPWATGSGNSPFGGPPGTF